MNDRTEQIDTAVMQKCPTWCDQVHRDPMAAGDYHHMANVDLVPLRELPGRDSSLLEVGVSLLHTDEREDEARVPMVEVHGLENSGCLDKGLLTAGEARRLAGWLIDAADLIEAPAAG